MTFFKKAGRARKFQSQINANGLKDGLRVADVACFLRPWQTLRCSHSAAQAAASGVSSPFPPCASVRSPPCNKKRI